MELDTFTGIDYNSAKEKMQYSNSKTKNGVIAVDEEYGNFDYLMGADIDF